MGDRGTLSNRPKKRLGKRDVERLLAGYDDDPIAALTASLRLVLDMPEASWAELVSASPTTDERRDLLRRGDEAALDDLAAELNERRCLGD